MDGIKKAAGTVGDVVKTAATVAPYVLPLVGLGKEGKPKRTMAHLSEWNSLVAKVRQETGKSLKDTLKYIKENNLYKKKGKTTTTAKKTKKGYLSWTKEEVKPRPPVEPPKPEELPKAEGAGKSIKRKPRKTGGSSGGPLINEVVKERVKGDVVAEPRATGGLPSLKVPKTRAKRILAIK
jgi:predicted lipoprotein with Yx(FWY)xxD motif